MTTREEPIRVEGVGTCGSERNAREALLYRPRSVAKMGSVAVLVVDQDIIRKDGEES